MNKDNLYRNHTKLITQALIEINPLNFELNLYDNYYNIVDNFLNNFPKNINLVKYLNNYSNIKELLNSYEEQPIENETYHKLLKRINYYLSYLEIFTLFGDKITLTPNNVKIKIHNDFIITIKEHSININNKRYKILKKDIYTQEEIIKYIIDELNEIINNNDLIYIEYNTPHCNIDYSLNESYFYVVNSKYKTYEDIFCKDDISKIFNNKELL